MPRLPELLAHLPEQHRRALLWFAERAGTEQPWPRPLSTPGGEVLLASRPKGIYKPAWSRYALSVRQSLDSPYKDREPILRPDGTWFYLYSQENDDPLARDMEFTNRALLDCWRDSVPVGVMLQTRGKPDVRYRILGLALVAGWDGGYFSLEGFSSAGLAHDRGPAGEIESIAAEEPVALFDPASLIDGRRRAIRQIVQRRGQPEFRKKLLTAYQGCCALSGCAVEPVLEAAHIIPYRGHETNTIQNGLLIRADLHTLFDLGLIAIHEETLQTLLSPKLGGSIYQEMASEPLRLPKDRALWPSPAALRYHREWSGL